MRWIRDIALIAGLATVGLGFTTARQEQRSRDALLDSAIKRTREMEQMVQCRAATKAGELNARGWPVTIDPSWFEHSPPTNPLLDGGEHPWVEVAPASDAHLFNPRIRIAVGADLAQFWYNPYQGLVRARVPVMVSDELAVQTYNRINGTALATIFDTEKFAEPAEARPAPEPAREDVKPRRRRPGRTEPVVRVHHAVPDETPPAP